ncbi:MAG: hypothetical protein LBT86_07765 [Deltaproteobacteria bacterium]|nr:hypothetical protein [Deltaproteobacteria bacterium]
MTYGRVIRQAINDLAGNWRTWLSVEDKLDILARWFATFGGQAVTRELTGANCSRESQSLFSEQTFPPIAVRGSVHAPISV